MTTMMISRAEPNWLDLLDEIWNMIGHRVIKLEDFIRLQAVCKPLRRALAPQLRSRQSVPWLMLPYCRDSIIDKTSARVGCKGTDSCRCFYDPKEQRFRHIEFPEGLNKTWCGSALGWLFAMERSPSLSLINPLTKDQVSLPPITAFPDVLGFHPEKLGVEYVYLDKDGLRVAEGRKTVGHKYITKVCLSAKPTSEECVVMVIRKPVDRTLAFCRVNSDDRTWTMIPRGDGVNLPLMIAYQDVVFWRGQFYALNDMGRVYVCDLSVPHCPKLSLYVDPRAIVDRTAIKYYLLTSPGDDELMMVTRSVSDQEDEEDFDDGDDGDTDDNAEWDDDDDDDDDEEEEEEDNDGDLSEEEEEGPRPYDGDGEEYGYSRDSESDDDQPAIRERQALTSEFRVFKLRKDRGGWDELGSIGDFALFLGLNTANWVSTKDNPEFAPNSIYFSDDVTDSHRKRRLAGADMGVYNLTTRTFNPFYCTASVHKNPSLIFPLPTWISPSSY